MLLLTQVDEGEIARFTSRFGVKCEEFHSQKFQ